MAMMVSWTWIVAVPVVAFLAGAWWGWRRSARALEDEGELSRAWARAHQETWGMLEETRMELAAVRGAANVLELERNAMALKAVQLQRELDGAARPGEPRCGGTPAEISMILSGIKDGIEVEDVVAAVAVAP